jgi:hypothetical protein
MSLPSSGMKSKPNKKLTFSRRSSACHLIIDGFLLSLLVNPEDGSDIFLRNFDGLCDPEDRALHNHLKSYGESVILYRLLAHYASLRF